MKSDLLVQHIGPSRVRSGTLHAGDTVVVECLDDLLACFDEILDSCRNPSLESPLPDSSQMAVDRLKQLCIEIFVTTESVKITTMSAGGFVCPPKQTTKRFVRTPSASRELISMW